MDSWLQHKQIGWVLVTPAVLRPGGAQLLLDYRVSRFPEQPACVTAREGNRLNIEGRTRREGPVSSGVHRESAVWQEKRGCPYSCVHGDAGTMFLPEELPGSGVTAPSCPRLLRDLRGAARGPPWSLAQLGDLAGSSGLLTWPRGPGQDPLQSPRPTRGNAALGTLYRVAQN